MKVQRRAERNYQVPRYTLGINLERHGDTIRGRIDGGYAGPCVLSAETPLEQGRWRQLPDGSLTRNVDAAVTGCLGMEAPETCYLVAGSNAYPDLVVASCDECPVLQAAREMSLERLQIEL